jgi:hypothetical protein
MKKAKDTEYKTRKEIIVDLERKVGGLISANTLIQQAFVKTHQLMESRWDAMSKELQELNYIKRAMLALGSFDQTAVEAKADEFKLTDFSAYCQLENESSGSVEYTGEATLEDAIVVQTKCSDKDLEIFRARLVVNKIEDESFRKALVGKKAGDVFDHTVRGVLQTVHVISVFRKSDKEAPADEQKQTSAA